APALYLDQAWSQEDREWYHHFSQGSAAVYYDIFLNLEVAGSQELFRSDANSDRFGLIPEAANSGVNPDGLPIGISKTVIDTPRWKGQETGEFAGLTCAACHVSQWNYEGKHIRIEGGVGNRFDFMAYVQALDDALQATLSDGAKFDRLAARLKASSADANKNLRGRLERDAARVHYYRNRTMATPSSWGPGRLDPVSLIYNRVTAETTSIPENWTTPIAPVKPPFLWNAPQGEWTQWNAVMWDPIVRNVGETLGVFLPMNLHAKSPAEGLFESNAAILELQRAENQLERLAPPKWPEEVFGKIDRAKAQAGKALFEENCASCHNVWPYRWTEPNKYGKRFILVGLVPQTYVGTDSTQFQVVRPWSITGHLSNYLPPDFRGKAVVPGGSFLFLLQDTLVRTAISKLKLTDTEAANVHGYRELPEPTPPQGVYKAAPRDGVWATPPFLHNGSVPNLYEMLIPAKDRTKKFYVGREFDPVKVGVDTSAGSGKFLMDTTLLGNSNAGHSFEDGPRGNGVVGPLLTEDQRWSLVEYLKSIPEEPGRVTPFGGFPERRLPQP
ncbi:MAG TPA: di-heme-cytochrome C peroxidase, partial [Chthoniobacterales bacterium]|nr:di-heme-cytochrome C peroxidase [Chthoniobacterales bacterium]